jgi:hypothetical protein
VPLIDFGQPPHLTSKGVHWQMIGGAMPVTASIALGVLADVESAGGGEDPVEKFEDHRDRLCQVASAKFDAGEIHPDGSILITGEDLLRY